MKEKEERYKQTVINTLKKAVAFFEEHQLPYFMACGSALGAARHHGMIPWDDDTDIYMLRGDYERLLSMRPELNEVGLELAYLEKGKDYYAPFAKLFNNNTTLWETSKYRYVIGSFIDIFPLDFADYGMQRIGRKWSKLRSLFYQYQFTIEKHTIKDYYHSIRNGKVVDVFKWGVKRILYTRKRDSIIAEMIAYERTVGEESKKLLVSYTETQQYVFPFEWFQEYIKVPFEDFEVRLPKGYKEYLTYFYGDYMKLPPIEKRYSTHEHYYLNLSESLDIYEIMKRLKDGKTIEF